MSLPPALPIDSSRRLLDAIVRAGEPEILVFIDGRRPWRLTRTGPGWRAETFTRLCEAGWIVIRVGFAGGVCVSLTDQARAAYGLPPAPEEKESSTPAENATCFDESAGEGR